MSQTQDVLHYMYRDASNYKAAGKVVLSRPLRGREKEELMESLQEGLYFIPEQVGLPPCSKLWEEYGVSEDDHPWHECYGVREEVPEEGMPIVDTEEFLKALRAVGGEEGWDECCSTISQYPQKEFVGEEEEED